MQQKPIIGLIPDYRPGGDGQFSIRPHYALTTSYINMLQKSNANVLVLPYNYDAIDFYLNLIDGLIIIGGAFDINPNKYGESKVHPKTILNNVREDFEFEITKQLVIKKSNMPIFGICNGMQIINIVFGGSIDQNILDHKDKIEHEQSNVEGFGDYSTSYHDIKIIENSKLFQIIGKNSTQTNSSHHQAVKEVGSQIQISAFANDGVVEAIEHKSHPFCLGVQWHPELTSSEIDPLLFQAFCQASLKYQNDYNRE